MEHEIVVSRPMAVEPSVGPEVAFFRTGNETVVFLRDTGSVCREEADPGDGCLD